jgi:hypothetical protein
MYDQNEKLKEIINSDKLDITLTMNILINAVKANWEKFNTVDKFLIGKSLQTIEYYFEKKEDIVIKFKKDVFPVGDDPTSSR